MRSTGRRPLCYELNLPLCYELNLPLCYTLNLSGNWMRSAKLSGVDPPPEGLVSSTEVGFVRSTWMRSAKLSGVDPPPEYWRMAPSSCPFAAAVCVYAALSY
jgi:hypothetical protein